MCMRDEPILASNQIGVILARDRPSGPTGTSTSTSTRTSTSTSTSTTATSVLEYTVY